MSRIAAAEIDRVEIVRGAQSALWGSDAIGSVVQIVTRRGGAGDAPRITGSVQGGTFRTRRGDTTYFDNDYRDQIAFRSGSVGAGLPEFISINGSRASGWEPDVDRRCAADDDREDEGGERQRGQAHAPRA